MFEQLTQEEKDTLRRTMKGTYTLLGLRITQDGVTDPDIINEIMKNLRTRELLYTIGMKLFGAEWLLTKMSDE